MAQFGYRDTLIVQQAAGTLLNTYTTAKSVINPQALCTVPGSLYWYIGKTLHISFLAGLSNIVTTPGLFNVQIKIGSAVAYDSGNIQLNATAHTTLPLRGEIDLVCRSVGSGTSATVMGDGQFTSKGLTLTAGQTDDAQGHMTINSPQTAPAVGAGFDSTIANIIDMWVGFTISNAGNGIQIQRYSVEQLN